MKIAIIDTYYPDFIASLPFDATSTYEVELRKVLDRKFGTFDAYSRHLTALGNECVDIIANHGQLQQMWRDENVTIRGTTVASQLAAFKPDVIFLQDLSIKVDKGNCLLAAQCSCAFDDESAKKCDVIFTSLPTHVKRIEALGVRAVYLPLAFDPSVLRNVEITRLHSTEREFSDFGDPERDIDISFVGGVGRDSHWRYGTDVLEAVATEFKGRFQWWGYGADRLPQSSALLNCYQGSAFGNDMYSIYRRSKCVVNRHGEVSCGFTNNLRCFEACGSGALLLTEQSENLLELFPPGTVIPYTSSMNLCEEIHYCLSNPSQRKSVADAGRQHVLKNHTYAQRMPRVSQVLVEMLCLA